LYGDGRSWGFFPEKEENRPKHHPREIKKSNYKLCRSGVNRQEKAK
jgi:hypothetical protein